MSDSPNLALPYLEAAQAQKHVTHNESLSLVDGLLHLAVKSRNTAAPPATPLDGDRYLIPAAPTGDWTGHATQIALRMEGAWRFLTPREGWTMWINDENTTVTYDGSTWISSGTPTSLQNLALLGVNATADATNRLAVNSSAVLFNNVGNGVQFKVNKNAAVDTASILFQTGFSGRAEIGTAGDDSFHFKVSSDGSTFNEAIVIDAASGATTVKKTIVIDPQPADPATQVNGQLWYNSTTGKFRARQNGSSVDVTGGGASTWGTITGTLSSQTDLQTALNGRAAAIHSHALASVTDVTMTATNLNSLDDGIDSTLHFHASDRSRANHSGTQLAATISDFSSAADARVTAANKQGNIQFKDEGVNLGTAGSNTVLDFVGAGVTATSVGGTVTVTIPGTTPTWGAIFGTLSSQTDLQTALNAKAAVSHSHTLVNISDVTVTAANLNALDDGLDTTLHFHASDRNRTNHSGTQVAATISDFAAAADARIAASALDTLSDVTITTPVTNQVLTYNGSVWVNQTASASGGGQAAILFQDEGAGLGASGTIDTINVKGDDITASRSGNALTIEQKLYKRKIEVWATAGATAISSIGVAITASGAATAATPASTGIAAQQSKVEYLVTVAATTAIAGFRAGALTVWRGNGAALGGFRYRCRWGSSTGGARQTKRCFVGLQNSTAAPTDVEPSTLLNMIGVGFDAADANIQLMTNAAAGTATKTNLGANFPVPSVDRADVYDIEIACGANDTVVTYKITNVVTGVVASGQLNTNLPANTALLAPRGWMSVGGTSSVIGIALMSLTLESDY